MLIKDVQGSSGLILYILWVPLASYYYIACGGFILLHYFNSPRPLIGIIEEVHSFGH